MTAGKSWQAAPRLPRLRAALGPRPRPLILFAAVLVVLCVAFAWVVLRSQTDTRHQARKRFEAQSSLSAQLISTLFATALGPAQKTAAQTFGGATVDARAVARTARSSGYRYLVILDASGKVLAASPHTPARFRSGAPPTEDVRRALGGHGWLSNVLPPVAGSRTKTLEYALPFQTAHGRRVEVQATDGTAIFTFLDSYLAKTRTDTATASFILDRSGRIIATAGPRGLQYGAYPKARGLLTAFRKGDHGTYGYGGAQRYFASTPVGGSGWRVVLSIPTDSLYPTLAGRRGFLLDLVIAAFALLGFASLMLFRRALATGVALEASNRELTALNAGLEARVAERTAAAEDRARELARSNEELEQFSSVASHDLQEPLRKIRMFGDRLRDRLDGTLAEDADDDLRRMQNAAERMQRLIGDLLDFSRVTHRGKQFEPVDLQEVAEEVVADLEVRILELDATVDVGELPTIDADRTQMRQLLQNLIGNALKFHRPGEPPVIRVGAAAPANGSVVLTVADNGIGFDERYAERIFGAFERLHGRSAYDGTGIGLSIARKIAWRHGGEITARATPGEGATFTVTLPLHQAAPVANGSRAS
jgi:signal transduction histidine kinase